MKTKLEILFETKPNSNLSIFITAGFPKKENLLEIIPLLDKSECDIIEIGIPFSDPLADGTIIQQSSTIALNNGMTLDILLQQVKQVRKHTLKPIVLMGYLNTLLKYGLEKFYLTCYQSGVDGLIIPDLPLSEFKNEHKTYLKKYNIDFIFLITPNTVTERALNLAKESSGFLYLVSSNSTTGNNNSPISNLTKEINTLKNSGLTIPILVGFGIKNADDFENVCEYANGAIIGSAFVQLVQNSLDLKKDIPEFINSIKTKKNDNSIK